jgi:hypothetical protein
MLRSRAPPRTCRDQPVEPLARDVVGHVVAGGEPRRRRAVAHRELERERVLEAQRVDRAQRLLEVGVGLAREADDDVRREVERRDRVAQPRTQSKYCSRV